ncbi:hypothetical protein C1637_03660 [Chryseobacterium lactis]|uniref:Tetratricopeptide repeat protein n=1 Tax=Chryseobacterium lactis TaxID=1241981 RepID=A0A3G6RNZ9_CHRLC|nr:hypothetical protein [Chryseobacterium lactis]AZA81683.1 hypothetical protein EG342_07055 [Chryseobacterium lactis]AZB06681.1 hypothetical protein EG341_23175 [Chryseobacterium lactis]PNW15532.1 hypothetical protein C1637_03660 [Chryseobacterium lactis]
MNKTLLIFTLFIISFGVKAQSFTDKTLQQSALQLNTSNTEGDFDKLFKKFTETKTSEKWQAYYYAAASLYLKADFLFKKSPTSPVTELNATASKIAFAASHAQPDNAEINILLGLITLQSIQAGIHRYPEKGLQSVSEYISKAETTASGNPRLAILKAKLAEKSGNKSEAETQYQKAATEFTSSDSLPGWGKQLIHTN